MRNTRIYSVDKSINCEIDRIASDKSISHRSVIFAFLSNKTSRIKNYLFGEDTLNTLKIAILLGMSVKCGKNTIDNIDDIKNNHNKELLLTPNSGILEPSDILDCGNAGTAIRLYMGLLANAKGQFILSGDKYLNSRPMGRIIEPLQSIGANISARANNTLAPICINGAKLKAFNFVSKISSAQVKSAMILSGLNLDNQSTFEEIFKSRDHSERMLLGMGADLKIKDSKIVINPIQKPLNPLDIEIPSDPSSAFYFAILAAILPESKIVLKNILLNETRIEAFYILQKMGVKLEIIKKDSIYEDIGDICIQSGNSKDVNLTAVEIKDNISWLIDEIPSLGIAFAFAKGKSKIIHAKELRYKESDRIKATLEGLRAFGVECEELEDGFIVEGGIKKPDKIVKINSYGDHRIAMSFALLGVLYNVEIEDSGCIDVSFPNFLDILSDFTKVENYDN